MLLWTPHSSSSLGNSWGSRPSTSPGAVRDPWFCGPAQKTSSFLAMNSSKFPGHTLRRWFQWLISHLYSLSWELSLENYHQRDTGQQETKKDLFHNAIQFINVRYYSKNDCILQVRLASGKLAIEEKERMRKLPVPFSSQYNWKEVFVMVFTWCELLLKKRGEI